MGIEIKGSACLRMTKSVLYLRYGKMICKQIARSTMAKIVKQNRRKFTLRYTL